MATQKEFQTPEQRRKYIGTKQIILAVLCMFALIACGRKAVYESYKTIGPKGWQKDSVLRFDFNVQDPKEAYNLYVNLRNKGNYPNSNIWLFLSVYSPEGISLVDTMEFSLADNDGRWKGKGIGDLFDNQLVYKSNVYFPKAGTYSFLIQHGMRPERLDGIYDVGIRVEKNH